MEARRQLLNQPFFFLDVTIKSPNFNNPSVIKTSLFVFFFLSVNQLYKTNNNNNNNRVTNNVELEIQSNIADLIPNHYSKSVAINHIILYFSKISFFFIGHVSTGDNVNYSSKNFTKWGSYLLILQLGSR